MSTESASEALVQKALEFFRPAIARKRRGWTQEQLAERMSKTQNHVARHEGNFRGYTHKTVAEYMAALDCEPWELFGYAHPPDVDLTDEQRALIRLVATMPPYQVNVLLAAARAMEMEGVARANL